MVNKLPQVAEAVTEPSAGVPLMPDGSDPFKHWASSLAGDYEGTPNV